ncbi:MAG: hypothetical protein RIS41_165 [Actinomycetota bacterium]
MTDMDHLFHPPPVHEGSTPLRRDRRVDNPEPDLDRRQSKQFRRLGTLVGDRRDETLVTRTRKRGTMRRLSAIFLAAALALTAACSSGDKSSEGSSDGPSRALFQPAGVVGPDSFAPTFAVASYDVDPSTLSSGEVSGSAPGLYAGRTYGGTGANICDVEAMIRFLTYYEDRGRAWADIQGIEYSELETYLRSLTPVFALQNLNVQMFGFKNGSSYGYDAVIAAGTAILVDDQGMPRARCACGNPLLGPSEDAPEGTEEPPTTDGNPETQDSVPGDSVPGDSIPEQPGDSVPVDSVPGDSVPDDSVPPTDEPECPEEIQGTRYTDANGVEWIWTGDSPEEAGTSMWLDQTTGETRATSELDPSFADCGEPDQPRTQEEPECPDWNSDPVTYTDPSGMVWIYDRSTDTWFSTTDADLFKVPTDELPGYLELCDEPGQRQPGGDCPEPFRGSWTDYYASNGDVWRWEFTSPETGQWVNQNGDIVNFLVDIPGYLEDCGDPRDTYEPECPEPINGIAAMDWTPYYASNGDLWVYVWQDDLWKSQDTGATVAGYDPSAIPGYIEDCGEPPVDENPCPPTKSRVGDTWTDPETGETWIFDYVGTTDGRSAIRWTNTTTGEQLDDFDLYVQECGEPATPKVVCPPTKATIGTVWVDTTGEEWVFAAGSGGADGWDQVSTPDIENLTYAELPNKPSGCPEPQRPLDCPPIRDIPEGYVWFGTDGNVYRYLSSEGGWLNENDPSGQVVPYTVLLPGYREACLPPCPPVNVHETSEFAIWVDPSTGEVWVKFPQSNSWTNVDNGQSRTYTTDLPFYTEDCLPPCDPESDGQPTYVTNDDGLPETNPDKRAQYGDADDSAVTVTPGDSGVDPQPIAERLLTVSTADGDECNPNGCVEPETEPELGHSFRDSRGVLWRYVGNGEWQAENGDFVTYILDIPGYVDACLPPDTPIERECPPEFKGSEYTDTNGITWTWVGSHSTPDESDHGQFWFHYYEDGSTEYRYTFQLEPFFSDCPKPDDVETQSLEVFVSMQGPKQACVGDQVIFYASAWDSEGNAVREARFDVDGTELPFIESEPGFFSAAYDTTGEGTFTVTVTATDEDGNEATSSITLVVSACDDTTDQGDPITPDTPDTQNSAPVVDVSIDPTCVEGKSEGTTKVSVKITVSDADGDSLSVSLSGGASDRSLPPLSDTVNGSGSKSFVFEVDYRDRGKTFTFTGTADDGEDQASDAASVTVLNPGGCGQSTDTSSAPSTPTNSTPTNSSPNNPATNNTAPTVTIATKPSGTVTVCKSGTGSSVPVTATITANDPQGDSLAITLATYNKTISLGTTARAVGTISGTGSVTATETFTAAQIGQTIELIARAADASLTGIARIDVKVVERTTGCTVDNTAPKVALTNKTWPACISPNGSPVSFTVSDTAGTKLSIVIKVAGKVVQDGTRSIPVGSTSTSVSYTFTANQVGQSVSVEVTDDKGASAQPLTTTLTKETCPG